MLRCNLKGTDTELSESESDFDSSFTDSESDDDCILNEAPNDGDNNRIDDPDIIDISSIAYPSSSSHNIESTDSSGNNNSVIII